MNDYFRAVAIDYDGTLADADRPSAGALEAIAELRSAGRRVILVTGRILEELRAVFPDVDRRFDAIVAENGAVASIERATRFLSAPVELELDEALVDRAVPFRRGRIRGTIVRRIIRGGRARRGPTSPGAPRARPPARRRPRARRPRRPGS